MNLFTGRRTDQLQWLNEPEEWRFFSDQSLFIRAGARTECKFDASTMTFLHTAPFLFALAQDDFEVTTRLRVEMKDRGDAGCLVIMANPTNWARLSLQLNDEHATMMSTVTRDGLSDDSTSMYVSVDDPTLRMTKADGRVQFSFSENGQTWSHIRTFGFPESPSYRIGVMAQSPEGEGCEVTFDMLSVTPLTDDTVLSKLR